VTSFHIDPSSPQVGIVGAGPVGMALALLLDRHGVTTLLFDADPEDHHWPRGSTLNARSMELFRQLGLSRDLRTLGLPEDHPTDVRYVTRLDGFELARLPGPSARDNQRAVAASSELDQVPEPMIRANQMYVEPYLIRRIAERHRIDYRPGWRVERFAQDTGGVTIWATHAQHGPRQWQCQYLAGCDGARSTVRRQLGIALRGFDGAEDRYFGGAMLATHVRAPALYTECLRDRPAFQYWIGNRDARATLIALDGRGEFLMFTQPAAVEGAPDGAADSQAVMDVIRRCIGRATAVEILGTRPWRAGVALVADRFHDRRVFLAGDAVHLFTPTGGFGMNTGIDDAANLAWKLAASLQGWGGPGLLASYEAERMPVALRNVTAARRLALRVSELRIPPEIDSDSPAGAAQREAMGRVLAGFSDQFDSLGVQLGARYDGSAIVIGDEPPPADLHDSYEPSGVPGGRAPHFWIDAGRGIGSSLFDRLGTGLTLLRWPDSSGEHHRRGHDLVNAARQLSVPLDVIDVQCRGAQALYGRTLALIRPDMYLAWRGNGVVDDALARSILGRVTATR
jgi:2-polyprenyl-6-methoxyphenol hydroxylase-like FAD-dependent oxidoreductase